MAIHALVRITPSRIVRQRTLSRQALRRPTLRALILVLAAALGLLAVGAAPASAASGPVMYPKGIGADLGPTPNALGTTVRAGVNAAGLRTGTLAGKTYWQTQVSAGTTFFGFAPNTGYVTSLAGKSVVVLVTYYDTGSGELTLRTAAGTTKDLAALGGSNTWKRAAAELSTVEFASGTAPELRLSGTSGGSPTDITVAQVRITAAGPSATLGPIATNDRLTPNPGDNPAGLITGTVAGRGYWQTNAAAPAPATNFFYMNVDDNYAYNTTDTVLVSVDYFDSGNGTLDLQYDSPGPTIPDMFKPSEIVHYGNSGTWQTHDFVLDDAILTDRTNGSDFRIAHDGSNVEIEVAAVRVTVVPVNLDVKAGLRALIAQSGLAVYAAREGTRDGQYPPGSKAALSAVIAQAQQVVDDPSVTEARVAAALQTLYTAYQAFLASAVDLNLARHATLTASGSATGSSPSAANDGAPGTVWTSGNGGAGEWLQADLGTARPVNDVLVQWGQSYSPDYTVRLSSDGQTFTTVGHSGAPGSGGSSRTRFATATARYVRLLLNGYAPGATSFDVAEFQIRDDRVVTTTPRLIDTAYPTQDSVIADFDATAYGADPHGVKDSTAAIQAALYDCYDAGGGTVWLPDGDYRVTGTVEVPAFCTLRGDHRTLGAPVAHGDPTGYGTVVTADFGPGDNGPVLFRIGGSAGVVGVTTYYPNQNAASPVPYNYTFEIPGSAWASDENYMMATVSDVTMLDSYRGIGISTMLDERGRPPGIGQTHESATVRNVTGTALFEGVGAYNGADVGTWQNVNFSNAVWASAPPAYHPPLRSTLDAWTRANGTGFVIGDLEWDQFAGLSAADYHIGIHVVQGERVTFTGEFQQVQIQRTDIAVLVDVLDTRWGMSFVASRLEGSQAAVTNNTAGYVKLTDTKVVGALSGIVYQLAGTPPRLDQEPVTAKPDRAKLYVATTAPYSAARGDGYTPAQDATAAIQSALDRAGREGGGVVYLPAGWYRIDGRLTVPAGVELRGASSVPNRDEDGRSGGTVLMLYAGRATANPDTDPAAITLAGGGAGVSGLRVFYPKNNPAQTGGVVAYPYAIRGVGDGTYVVNVSLPNAWNAIDMSSPRDNHFRVSKVDGTFFRHGITVGANDGGRIDGVLTNGNTLVRTAFYVPNWVRGQNLFPQVIDGVTRQNADLITVNGARDLTILDVFGYGLHNGLVVNSGEVRVFNQGTDNLGTDGYTDKVASTGADVTVVNLMRYNGTTSTGPARITNVMVINIVQHNVSATVAPAGSGAATLSGNETVPGAYENGSQVTAAAVPAPGFHFVDWTVAGQVVSTAPAYAFTVTADTALTANFTPNGHGG
jgi:hypothetical protein